MSLFGIVESFALIVSALPRYLPSYHMWSYLSDCCYFVFMLGITHCQFCCFVIPSMYYYTKLTLE